MLTVVPKINFPDSFLIQKDLKSFFAKFDLDLNFQAFFDQSTYDFEKQDFNQSWLYYAFNAFKKLSNRADSINSFATIGTGSGIDAIGALEIFKPREIILTDLNNNALKIARLNLLNYLARNPVSYKILQGNICEPLIKENLKLDLIYANLPNITVTKSIDYSTIDSASYIEERLLDSQFKNYQAYLLTTAYQFLKTAKECLTPQGKVLLNIGARVPNEFLKIIFKESGYFYEEIYNGFRLQTETEMILKGYSTFEKNGIEFDFYLFDEGFKILSKYQRQGLSVEMIKLLLKDIRISSSEALQFFYQGKKIGHIVSLILGKQLS